MMTVGYGDIAPVTQQERIYVIIMTLTSTFIFGYAINTVGAIFSQKDLEESSFKYIKKIIIFNLFFLNKKEKENFNYWNICKIEM